MTFGSDLCSSEDEKKAEESSSNSDASDCEKVVASKKMVASGTEQNTEQPDMRLHKKIRYFVIWVAQLIVCAARALLSGKHSIFVLGVIFLSCVVGAIAQDPCKEKLDKLRLELTEEFNSVFFIILSILCTILFIVFYVRCSYPNVFSHRKRELLISRDALIYSTAISSLVALAVAAFGKTRYKFGFDCCNYALAIFGSLYHPVMSAYREDRILWGLQIVSTCIICPILFFSWKLAGCWKELPPLDEAFLPSFLAVMTHDEYAATLSNKLSELMRLLNVSPVEFSPIPKGVKAGLIDSFLKLQRAGTDNFLATHILKGINSSPNLYGGQVIAQGLSAATATVEIGFIPNSLHSYFVQSGNVDQPILYQVDRIRDGRSFCTRLVKAIQNGEAIFTMQVSFHKLEANSIIHHCAMPKVPGPDYLDDWTQIIDKASKIELPPAMAAMVMFVQKKIPPAFFRVFSLRPVNGDLLLTPHFYDVRPDQEKYKSHVWIKVNENIDDDSRLHTAVAAYISNATMIETALGPHSRKGFIPSMALTLDHCIWMHTDKFRVDDWLLYESHSTIASGGRSLIEGK